MQYGLCIYIPTMHGVYLCFYPIFIDYGNLTTKFSERYGTVVIQIIITCVRYYTVVYLIHNNLHKYWGFSDAAPV